MNVSKSAGSRKLRTKTISVLLIMTAYCSLFGAPSDSTVNSPIQIAQSSPVLDPPTGPQVFGVFDGRSPCQEIASQLNIQTTPECIKIKWRLILFQDPATHAPTSYTLERFVFRKPPKTGKWTILKGIKTDPNAIVYQLDPGENGGFLSFFKADENILFFLDKDQKHLVGNIYFSYTLNRVVSK